MDGIPKHLPALMRAEKLIKKARKAKLLAEVKSKARVTKSTLAEQLYSLAEQAQANGWSSEELLRKEIQKRERALRRLEAKTKAKE